MINKPKQDWNLDDVRAFIKEVREEGLKIQSHYKRLEQEYSDWEDRVRDIEQLIAQAELDTGLTKEEIYTPPVELLFGEELDLTSGFDEDENLTGDIGEL